MEHCTSSTSIERDITTTVSNFDTRRLCLRDDTSCRRQCLEGEYSDQQLARTYTTTSTTSSSTTSYLAGSKSDGGQFLFANSYMHLPGQTISNIDQDSRWARPGKLLFLYKVLLAKKRAFWNPPKKNTHPNNFSKLRKEPPKLGGLFSTKFSSPS